MDDPEPKREGGRAARRASDTHQRLLQAALSIFNDLGFDGCAIEDITEKADVGKGTFYRHFHDKHAILSALVTESVTAFEKYIHKPPSVDQTPSLHGIVRAHIEMFKENRGLFLLFLQAHSMMATRRESLPELQIPFDRYWTLIEISCATNTSQPFNISHPRQLASVISGTICGILQSRLAALPGEMIDEKLDAVCNAIVIGIEQHLRCAV